MATKYVQNYNIYVPDRPTIILLPKSLSNHITRCKLSLIDLINPQKLSKYFSGQEIKTLIGFAEYEFDTHIKKAIGNASYSYSCSSLDYSIDTIGYLRGHQRSESRVTYSDEQISDLRALFSVSEKSSKLKPYSPELVLLDEKEFDKEKQYYSIKITDSNFILINIEQGFLNCLEDSELAFKFIKDLLKTLYSFLPIYSVSNEGIFSLYLALLRQNSA